jgi:hypothetical protein
MNAARGLVVFLSVLCMTPPGWSCTIFVVARNGVVLAGANEDMKDAPPWDRHWVALHGRSDGRLGFVTFGYNSHPLVPQAGLNEAGLFFDFNALPAKQVVSTGKPSGGLDHITVMMRTCRTVAEALELLTQYDFTVLSAAQMVLGDASGVSAIFEPGAVTSRGTADYQIGTNFRTSDTPKDKITCWRYKACDAALGEKKPVSMESVRALLEQTMPRTGSSRTWYSTVCDLKARRILLFRKGDFSRAVSLRLDRELSEGDRRLDMDELMQQAQPYEP